MAYLARDTDTICAVATPPGTGGISVVRVSGEQALERVRQICSFLPDPIETHRVYYGFARELQSHEVIDEILVSYFAKGRSFTGEQTLEISCHGSPMIASLLCQELISAGCRAAGPGEFTYRAFLNGRLDLVQAESVLALIESQSKQSAKVALRQLQGELSQQVEHLEDTLTWCLAHLEASIDFSTENLEVVETSVLVDKLVDVGDRLNALLRTYESGRVLRDGWQVALVGETNVGKSSLLNALTGEERSIVTSIPGTTRDLVEGRLLLDGIVVQILDTAGVRESEDIVERLGIERTRHAAEKADFLLIVLDATNPVIPDVNSSAPRALILNKVDLVTKEQVQLLLKDLVGGAVKGTAIFPVSAQAREGLEDLRTFLRETSKPLSHEQTAVITQARHFELLERARVASARARSLATEAASPDLLAFELQDALLAVQEILGKQFDDQVMDRVFKEFCIGK